MIDLDQLATGINDQVIGQRRHATVAGRVDRNAGEAVFTVGQRRVGGD